MPALRAPPPPQVCVPQLMAVTLTFPERVTEHNMEKLKQRVLNGARGERAVQASVCAVRTLCALCRLCGHLWCLYSRGIGERVSSATARLPHIGHARGRLPRRISTPFNRPLSPPRLTLSRRSTPFALAPPTAQA